MLNQFSRTELLFGKESMDKLKNTRIAVFGIGGVGSFTVEALARSGIGHFDLIDNDIISITNINRQIIATLTTVGKMKVDIMKQRILEINPEAVINVYKCFFLADNAKEFDFSKFDYIVDAVDTVSAKIELVLRANEFNIPIISCMGAGNKLDPTRFEVDDIYKTSICPLAKVMRKELRSRGIERLKVVYSKEPAIKPILSNENELTEKRQIPGSVSFVPSVAGLIIAGEVIKDLVGRWT